jgi:hypothetical protein
VREELTCLLASFIAIRVGAYRDVFFRVYVTAFHFLLSNIRISRKL